MNVRIQYPLNFTAGIYYNNQMQMNHYVAKLYMMTNTPDSAANNVAFDRIKHFVYNELDSSIFISSECEEQCKKYLDADLKITTFPGDPVDQLVGIMLFCKLSAIMEGRIGVLENELSSHLGDNMVYLHSENENTEDIKIPKWWTTPDLTHFELEYQDGDHVFSMAPGKYSAWTELGLGWPGEEPKETGNIVFANFGQDETK